MPSIVVIASDPSSRGELTAAIERRFGADYTVVDHSTARKSRAKLSPPVGPIAIALAPIGTAEFAAMGHVAVHQPGARRIAVVQVGDTSVAQALSQAFTLGHVDYYVGQPWASPEEELYPVLSEALRVWADDQQLRFEKVTIVAERERSRGVALATMLTRNGVTTRLLGCDSPEAMDLAGRATGGCGPPCGAPVGWSDACGSYRSRAGGGPWCAHLSGSRRVRRRDRGCWSRRASPRLSTRHQRDSVQ